MLIDVITRVATDTGYNLVQQRPALLNLAQIAASKMHKMLQCNSLHREVTLVVPPDAVVSLPSFVGEIIGLKMHTNELPFDLAAMSSPRYITTTLQYKFKNWRNLGESVVSILPSAGQLTFVSNVIENPPATILISGKSSIAAKTEEVLTLDISPKQTVNIFGPQMFKIASLSNRTGDIMINDVNGVNVATLYNTDKATRYKLIDVSQIFWTVDAADGGSFIDVCYKVPLTKLINDSDTFYTGSEAYDDAWYHMMMHQYYSPLSGREKDASGQLKLFLDAANSVKDSDEGTIIKKISFGRNKFFGLFRKYRYFPGSVTNVDHNVQN